MKLSNQAKGALMMALQKCLLEETDMVPLLESMDFELTPGDNTSLIVINPPVVELSGVQLSDNIKELLDEEEN
jgi:hypothetical protein